MKTIATIIFSLFLASSYAGRCGLTESKPSEGYQKELLVLNNFFKADESQEMILQSADPKIALAVTALDSERMKIALYRNGEFLAHSNVVANRSSYTYTEVAFAADGLIYTFWCREKAY